MNHRCLVCTLSKWAPWWIRTSFCLAKCTRTSETTISGFNIRHTTLTLTFPARIRSEHIIDDRLPSRQRTARLQPVSHGWSDHQVRSTIKPTRQTRSMAILLIWKINKAYVYGKVNKVAIFRSFLDPTRGRLPTGTVWVTRSFWRAGVTWSRRDHEVIRRAATFWTRWSGAIVTFGRPASTELK